MTPQELNSFLIEEYNFGLHPFALILSQTLTGTDISEFVIAPNKEIASDIKEKLLNLKKKIISVIADCDQYLLEDSDLKNLLKKNKKKAEGIVAKEYKMRFFFKTVNKIIKYLDLDMKFRHPGAPIKKRNLIASSWAHLLQDNGYKIEWDIIADLLDWFGEILKPYDIYKEINPKSEESDLEYLRNQFYRNKKRSLNYFEKMKRQWGHKKWLDIQETVFFGRKEHSLSDYSILPDLYDDYCSNKEDIPIFEAILAGEMDLLEFHPSWIRKAYDFYVSKLYKNNPTSPPTIIFPDLSYLQQSSSF